MEICRSWLHNYLSKLDLVMYIHSCNFTTGYAELGGGLYVYSASSQSHVYCVINGTSFTQNKALSTGGGLRIKATSNSLRASQNPGRPSFQIATINTVFSENMAKSTLGDGGGVFIDLFRTTNTATFIDSVFTGNIAFRGGSIFKTGGHVNLINCFFEDNKALLVGGAVFIGVLEDVEEQLSVSDSQFGHNTAKDSGGHITFQHLGVYNIRKTLIEIVDSVFQEGTAGRGGAISIRGSISYHSIIKITSCLFIKNYALMGGVVDISLLTATCYMYK